MKKFQTTATLKPQILSAILAINGCRIVNLTYRSKETGELAKYKLLLGVDHEKAVRRDLTALKRIRPHLKDISKEACEELISSKSETLTKGIGNNSNYNCADVYQPIAPGLKIHAENGMLYIMGYRLQKTVIEPGKHKIVKSAEKTIEKNKLRQRLKADRIRQFCLPNVARIAINGNVIEIE